MNRKKFLATIFSGLMFFANPSFCLADTLTFESPNLPLAFNFGLFKYTSDLSNSGERYYLTFIPFGSEDDKKIIITLNDKGERTLKEGKNETNLISTKMSLYWISEQSSSESKQVTFELIIPKEFIEGESFKKCSQDIFKDAFLTIEKENQSENPVAKFSLENLTEPGSRIDNNRKELILYSMTSEENPSNNPDKVLSLSLTITAKSSKNLAEIVTLLDSLGNNNGLKLKLVEESGST